MSKKTATRLAIAKALYEDNDVCICGHEFERSHDNDETECEAMINEYMGDCPCVVFRKR